MINMSATSRMKEIYKRMLQLWHLISQTNQHFLELIYTKLVYDQWKKEKLKINYIFLQRSCASRICNVSYLTLFLLLNRFLNSHHHHDEISMKFLDFFPVTNETIL